MQKKRTFIITIILSLLLKNTIAFGMDITGAVSLSAIYERGDTTVAAV